MPAEVAAAAIALDLMKSRRVVAISDLLLGFRFGLVVNHCSGQNAFKQADAGVGGKRAVVVFGFDRDDHLAFRGNAVDLNPRYRSKALLDGGRIGGVRMHDGTGYVHDVIHR